MDLDEAVRQLYEVFPERFMATRADLVKEARTGKDNELAKAISGLRKPSLSAWVVNTLSRVSSAEMALLSDLGDRLRAAQLSGSGAAMRDLGRERGRLVGSLVAAATTAAVTAARASGSDGIRVTAAVAREVSETFVAALASPDAAAAVCSGHLTRALSYAGLGVIDIEGATAGPVRPLRLVPTEGAAAGAPRRPAGRGEREGTDEQDAARMAQDTARAAAQVAAAEAQQALTATARRVEQTTERQREAQHAVDELERAVDEARDELVAATEQLRQATRGHRDAEQAARQALIALEAVN